MRKSSFCALALATGLWFVSVSASAGPESHRGGTLRIGTAAFDSLDPAIAYTTPSWAVQWATCSKLFDYPDAAGAAGARVVPEVVDHYAVSRDGKTYTFDLKRTFRFSTGERVTARSFADAFNRDANPALKSPAVVYVHEIVGADAVIAGKETSISGIRVLAPYRLLIRLRRRVVDFPARLTIPFFCPVARRTPKGPMAYPPGSGRYYIDSLIPNRQMVLKRNPFYRGSRPANPNQIVWTLGETRDACLADVEQDRIDYCPPPSGFPASAVRDIAGRFGINQPGGQFRVAPTISTNFFYFNHDRQAFRGAGQIPLEKAINYAIDRPALARAFGYEAGKRTDQILPPALGRAASIYPIQQAEPAIARKWLARARFKPASLVLYASSSPSGVAAAGVFAFDLKQIGIDVAISYYDLFTETTKAANRDEPFDVAMGSWQPDYADPAGFFEPLLDGSRYPRNGHITDLTHLDDPALNARIDAASALTGAARRKAWNDLDVDLMRNDPPWAPYLNFNSRDLVSRSFGCVVLNPMYDIDLAAGCKK